MVVTPDFKPLKATEPLSPLLLPNQPRPPLKQRSTGSFSHISDFSLDSPHPEDEVIDPIEKLEKLKHVDLSLDATEWRQPVFKTKILSLLRKLRIPKWNSPLLKPASIHLQKVSGACTNAVFFVSFNPSPTPTTPNFSPLLTPKIPPADPTLPISEKVIPMTLLLRVYGPSSGALISRTEELRILTVLSQQYHLGPKVYGTFLNGRIEQFFPSRALSPAELRDPFISTCIAKRMRELHSVDLGLLGFDSEDSMIWRFLREWLELAEATLTKLEGINEEWKAYVQTFHLDNLRKEMEQYRQFIRGKGPTHVVFAHNDMQHGNVLELEAELVPVGMPKHHRYIAIDFEYAAPGTRGYDIANHFHEWQANYHHPTHSWSLIPHAPYPTLDERRTFYRAYLDDTREEALDQLESEVKMWSPASSAFWALWGIISAEDHVHSLSLGEEREKEVDFDSLSYAQERVSMFRRDARELGAISN
ncbi:kinase-like domain-containing protein [Kockovaella imperatae]|uniref:Kinase-like domain-containing protein n=1 Tax=Kockovaella imperatae TaxID=4999 RepID=A0A1Y1UMX4_9TREE|nr:kinase-like domain-containing protein [Kockovaella imperatae]ORX39369.1 kinase-like domain-containing protein [Kockovaella imperatae]